MFDELRYIVGGQDFVVNDLIRIHNPTLAEIMDYGEEDYMADLSTLIMRPYDAMVLLDDIGVDYLKLNDFDMFIMMSRAGKHEKNLLMPDVDLSAFKIGENPSDGAPILYNGKCIIDKDVHQRILDYVRGIHFIKAEPEYKPGTKLMKKWLIDQKRKEIKKKKDLPYESQYAPLVSALVNNGNFKYDYASVRDLHVSQFWDAFYRVNKIQSYQNTMIGIYTGNVDAKKLDKSVLAWFDKIDINAEEKIDESQVIHPTK